MQFGKLTGQDCAAAAAEDFDVGTAFAQQVVDVFEKLHVSALITGDGNALRVFLNGALHDFSRRTVVSQMNHFRAGCLHDAPHDVDGRVVPIEQGGGGDNAEVVCGPVDFGGGCVHG